MSSSSSVASQPPVAYTPPVSSNDRAQATKAADEKRDDKAAEKAARVEDAAPPAKAKDNGKGQVIWVDVDARTARILRISK